MSDTPRTDEAKWEDDRGREVVDAYVAESLERELAATQARVAELNRICKFAEDTASDALARMATVERDALQRAADAIQGRISAHPLGSTAMVEAHKCQSAILALIHKEKA